MDKLPYKEILLKIDTLRSQGVEDNDPRIKALKEKLWLHLNKKKKTSQKKVVPKVTAIKTVKLKENPQQKTTLQKLDKSNLSNTEEEQRSYTKYILLGAALAVAALVYKFFNND